MRSGDVHSITIADDDIERQRADDCDGYEVPYTPPPSEEEMTAMRLQRAENNKLVDATLEQLYRTYAR